MRITATLAVCLALALVLPGTAAAYIVNENSGAGVPLLPKSDVLVPASEPETPPACVVNVDTLDDLEPATATVTPARVSPPALRTAEGAPFEVALTVRNNDPACAIYHVRFAFPDAVTLPRASVAGADVPELVLGQMVPTGATDADALVQPADGWTVIGAGANETHAWLDYEAVTPDAGISPDATLAFTVRVQDVDVTINEVTLAVGVRYPLPAGAEALPPKIVDEPYHWSETAFIVDATPPETEVHGIPEWLHTETLVTWTVTGLADGESAVTEYRIMDGEGEIRAWTVAEERAVTFGPDDFTGDGAYTLEYRSTDEAGNVEAAGTAALTVDFDEPQVEITAPADKLVTKMDLVPFAFTVTQEDEAADELVQSCTVERTDGGAAPALNCSHVELNLTGFADGQYVITVTVTHPQVPDHSNATSVTITRDTQAPLVTLLAPTEGLTNVSDILVNYSTNEDVDDSTCTLTLEDESTVAQACADGELTFKDVVDGNHSVSVDLTDLAGNPGSTGANFTVDATAPELTISLDREPPADEWVTENLTATIEAADALSGLAQIRWWFTFDDGTQAGIEDTDAASTIVDYPQGAGVRLHARAVDNATNEERAAEGPFDVDYGTPTITITPPSEPNAGGWFTEAPVLNVTITDAVSGVDRASVRYQIIAGDNEYDWVYPDASTFNVTLPDGAEVGVRVEASDLAGLTAERTTTPVSVDTVPPSLVITMDPEDPAAAPAWTSDTLTATVNASDATSGVATLTTWFEDADGIVDGTLETASGVTQVTRTFPDGAELVLHARVLDGATRETTRESDAFNVDTTAPVVSDAMPGAPTSGWTDTEPRVWVNATDATSPLAWLRYCVEHAGAACPTDRAQWEQVDGDGSARTLGADIVLPNGEDVVVRYEVQDEHGHSVEDETEPVNVDTSKPVPSVEWSATADGTWLLEKPTAWVNTTPGVSGLDYVRWRFTVDGEAAGEWAVMHGGDAETITIPADAVPVGRDVRLLVAVKTVAEAFVGPAVVNAPVGDNAFGVDVGAPEIEVEQAPTGVVTAATPVDVHVTDPEAGIASTRYKVARVGFDGKETTVREGVFTPPRVPVEDLPPARYVVDVTVTDEAGRATSARVATFVVDARVPTLTVDAPGEGVTRHGTFDVSGVATDDGPVRVRVLVGDHAFTPALSATGAFSVTADVAQGTYLVRVSAIDAADRTVTLTRNVTLAPAPYLGAPAFSSNATIRDGRSAEGGDGPTMDAETNATVGDATNATAPDADDNADTSVTSPADAGSDPEEESDDAQEGHAHAAVPPAEVLRAPLGLTTSPATVIFDAPPALAVRWRVEGGGAWHAGERAVVESDGGRVRVEYQSVAADGRAGPSQFVILRFDDGAPVVERVWFEPEALVEGTRTLVRAQVNDESLRNVVVTLVNDANGKATAFTMHLGDDGDWWAAFTPEAPGTYSARVTGEDSVGHVGEGHTDAPLVVSERQELVGTNVPNAGETGRDTPGAAALSVLAAVAGALALARRREA